MSQLPPCPKCNSEYVYEDGLMLVCGMRSRMVGQRRRKRRKNEAAVKDANGATLSDGDAVVVIKDLKVKGSSSVIKVGTKVKNIRLVDGDHNIDCKIKGIGVMKLKSEFVKKA